MSSEPQAPQTPAEGITYEAALQQAVELGIGEIAQKLNEKRGEIEQRIRHMNEQVEQHRGAVTHWETEVVKAKGAAESVDALFLELLGEAKQKAAEAIGAGGEEAGTDNAGAEPPTKTPTPIRKSRKRA